MTVVTVLVLVAGGLLLLGSESRLVSRHVRRQRSVVGAVLTLVGLVLAVGVLSGW